MQQVAAVSRRYIYDPRMTARELSRALVDLDLTAGNLARITGVAIPRVHRWLKDEDDIPIHVQASLYVWARNEDALRLAIQWADEHAQDVRTEE